MFQRFAAGSGIAAIGIAPCGPCRRFHTSSALAEDLPAHDYVVFHAAGMGHLGSACSSGMSTSAVPALGSDSGINRRILGRVRAQLAL